MRFKRENAEKNVCSLLFKLILKMRLHFACFSNEIN